MSLTTFEAEYDEAVRKWLADKLTQLTTTSYDYREFTEVRFDSEYLGPGCDTCGYGGGTNAGIFYRYQNQEHHYDLTGTPLGSWIAEVTMTFQKDEIPL